MKTTWEYCSVTGGMGQVHIFGRTKGTEMFKDEVNNVVNKLGAEGWEAFACYGREDSETWAMKRRKE
jgi:hypothetical protein